MTIEISYISDLEFEREDIFLVSNDADYVRACQALVGEAPVTEANQIFVRQKSHFLWLRHFTQQIGIGCNFTEKTPRLLLAEKWQVEIPEWLDDETVTAQNLLMLDILPGIAPRLVEAMLKHFLGPVWTAETLEPENLTSLITSLSSPERKEFFLSYPILSRCLEEKTKAWGENTQLSWAKEVCQSLVNDADNLWKDLTLRSLLAGYPSKLLDYVTTPAKALFLRSVPVAAVSSLPLHHVAVEQALTQIEMFFADISPEINSRGDFTKVLERVSGRLEKEYQFVQELLLARRFEPSHQDIDLIRQKFKGCPGVNAAKLANLLRFVKPPRPALPGKKEKWGGDRWVAWAVGEYIPYRHWQTQNQYFDPEVEAVAQGFSDWYIAEYPVIHGDISLSLVYLLDQWRDSISTEQFSVILLIDSLPLTYWNLLQEMLAQVGFYRHDQSYRFVPLPSHTENAKPLLISGKWDGGGKSYDMQLQARATTDWGGKKAVYLPNLKSLNEMGLPAESAVFLVNFLAMDETLHSDVESQVSTYEEELSRLFQQLSDAVRNLWERYLGQKELFSLYVITDHGACRVLEEEKNSLDSKVVNKLFVNEKHRMAQVPKSDVKTIPQNLWDLGYCFQQPFRQEDQVYFIPRGHNTVKLAVSTNGYVHGGATPEEVVVPAAWFRPMKVSWIEPAARFLNLTVDPRTRKITFYIQRVVQLQIEIQNLNNEAVKIIRVVVVSPDTEVKKFTTPIIMAKKYETLVIDCYFNKQAIEKEELHLQITYEINGEEQVKELKASAEFKSALAGGFSLRDL
jgi:hypothetical protein